MTVATRPKMLRRKWTAAAVFAFLCAVPRLLADLVVPPRLTWWLTAAVAIVTSLMTSAFWIHANHEDGAP